MQVKTIIVDDDAGIRSALRTILDALGVEVVGEADNGRSGVEGVKSLHPDLVLLDVSMPVVGGFAAGRELHRLMPHLPIIFISQHSERVYALEAVEIGAAGYVLKRSAATELADAIPTVMSGGRFISPLIART